ncbi:hypothetical protein cgp_2093 [Corynebacterium glutamicum MB001]|nr:hypothetical protein cgp_2093 [Corynebacterium glutamicum MB001]ASW14300.1 hypothetical protein cgc1_2093 [Corynebacterium glutamicum]QYO73892.1 hypothetical protein cgisf_2093 [Corynebacterium glutamicum]
MALLTSSNRGVSAKAQFLKFDTLRSISCIQFLKAMSENGTFPTEIEHKKLSTRKC